MEKITNEKQIILNDIHKILDPWIMRGEEDNYFRVKILISGNDTNSKCGMGLLMSGSRDAKDRIVFERAFFHEASQSMYRTINGKPLEDLDLQDLKDLQEAVDDYIQKSKVFPAILRDYYSDQLSESIDWFISVDFKRPVDGEMASISEDLETVDKQEAIFNDFDGAIYYAEKASLALERRGKEWNETVGDDRVFHVTFESYDPRILDIAKRYDGNVEISHQGGVPLTMVTFKLGIDARRFSEDVHRELRTDYFKTTAAAKIKKILDNLISSKAILINLENPVTLSYRGLRYKNAEIKNIRTIRMENGSYIVANASRSVRVDELTPAGYHKLLQALNDIVREENLDLNTQITESHDDDVLKKSEERKTYDSLEYDGKEWPIRVFELPHDGSYAMVATVGLEQALKPDYGHNEWKDEVAKDVDEHIFYYVKEDQINWPSKDLAALVEHEALNIMPDENLGKGLSVWNKHIYSELCDQVYNDLKNRIVTPSVQRFPYEADIHIQDLVKVINNMGDRSIGDVMNLIKESVANDGVVQQKPEKWFTDACSELDKIAAGEEQKTSNRLKR